MSNEHIVKSLLLMKAAYPRQILPDETIDLYTRALQDIEPSLLKTAVMQHIATSKWFPTIAELRGAAAALMAAADNQPSAYEAWGMVLQEVRRVGRWGLPELKTKTRQAVEAIGGWPFICDSQNIAADRARFIAAYEQRQKEEMQRRMELPLVTTYKRSLFGGGELHD